MSIKQMIIGTRDQRDQRPHVWNGLSTAIVEWTHNSLDEKKRDLDSQRIINNVL
jgi:hypothetical protein